MLNSWSGHLSIWLVVTSNQFRIFMLIHLQVEILLNELVESLSNVLRLAPSLSKLLLHSHKWAVDSVIQIYLEDPSQLLVQSKLKPEKTLDVEDVSKTLDCPICLVMLPKDIVCGVGCSHLFCKGCWNAYLETQVMYGVSTGISIYLFWFANFFMNTNLCCPLIYRNKMHGLFCDGNRRLCLAFTNHASTEGTLYSSRILGLRQVPSGTEVLSWS